MDQDKTLTMEEKSSLPEKETLGPEDIRSMVHVVRGKQVMLDSDLAKLYGVETKNLNKAVSRNLERFPEDYRFQVSQDTNFDFTGINGFFEVGRLGLLAINHRIAKKGL